MFDLESRILYGFHMFSHNYVVVLLELLHICSYLDVSFEVNLGTILNLIRWPETCHRVHL
jgi:hypothetical protein